MTAEALQTLPETSIQNLEHVPLLVSGSCYLVGTAIYIAVCVWLLLIYLRGGVGEELKPFIMRWVIRAFIVAVVSSVAIVIYFGRIALYGWTVLIPEGCFFTVLMIWYALLRHRMGMSMKEIFFNLILFEPMKVAGVCILCLGVWSVSILSGQGVLDFSRSISPTLDGLSTLFIITFWTALLLFLFYAAWQKLREIGDEEHEIWLGAILWPILVALGVIPLMWGRRFKKYQPRLIWVINFMGGLFILGGLAVIITTVLP